MQWRLIEDSHQKRGFKSRFTCEANDDYGTWKKEKVDLEREKSNIYMLKGECK